MTRATYNAKELAEVLGCSESKAYSYIRVMNSELENKGFLTLRGKVPREYVRVRFFGMAADQRGGETDNRDRKEVTL